MRKIATRLYTRAAEDCIAAVIGQLSDGYWENTSSMAKYWCYANITRDPDGQVIINVSEDSGGARNDYGRYGNGFKYKNDFEIKCFFADKIKFLIKAEFKDSLESKLLWSRDCKRTSDWISYFGEEHPKIEIRDAYLVYETLKGRSRASGKYAADTLKKVVGKPLTAEVIEALKKIKGLKAKRDSELDTLKFEYDMQCAVIKSKYEEQIAELKKIVE